MLPPTASSRDRNFCSVSVLLVGTIGMVIAPRLLSTSWAQEDDVVTTRIFVKPFRHPTDGNLYGSSADVDALVAALNRWSGSSAGSGWRLASPSEYSSGHASYAALMSEGYRGLEYVRKPNEDPKPDFFGDDALTSVAYTCLEASQYRPGLRLEVGRRIPGVYVANGEPPNHPHMFRVIDLDQLSAWQDFVNPADQQSKYLRTSGGIVVHEIVELSLMVGVPDGVDPMGNCISPQDCQFAHISDIEVEANWARALCAEGVRLKR